MCGRFIQNSDPEVYAACFDLELDLDPGRGTAEPARPRFNLAPTQMASVIRAGADGHRHLDQLRWGLIPFWSKGPDNRYQMINARAETVAEKPAYRAAFRERRCLVPAEGFYEWSTQGRLKQPYLIRRADRAPLPWRGFGSTGATGVGPMARRSTPSPSSSPTQTRNYVATAHDPRPARLGESGPHLN